MNHSRLFRKLVLSKYFIIKNFGNKTKRKICTSSRLYYCEPEENITVLTKLTQKIGFIGDGNMARAICKGIISKALITPSQVHVSSPYINNLDKWKLIGANVSTDNAEVAVTADVVFLAIKPNMLLPVVEKLKNDKRAPQIKDKLFVSILAGFSTTLLEKILSPFENIRVIRLMPNTPMMVGAGCTAYCPGIRATDMDISIVRAILDATGMGKRVPEHMMNAVNALSGGGPAFVYLFIEALSDGAVRMGLHRTTATLLAAQTVLGAAKMVLETDKHTGQLKDQVCSAGGTTIKGIHELEKAGIRGAIMNAIEASAKKAEEIGGKHISSGSTNK